MNDSEPFMVNASTLSALLLVFAHDDLVCSSVLMFACVRVLRCHHDSGTGTGRCSSVLEVFA